MLRRYVAVLAVLLLLAVVIVAPIQASTVTGSSMKGQINVVNASAGAAANSLLPLTLKTANLISGKYVNATVSNIAIQDNAGVDIPFMPAQGTGTAMMLFIDDIQQSATNNYYLYTGGTTSGGAIRWFPNTTGMSVADAANLELASGDYTIELKGFFDCSAGGIRDTYYLVKKSGVFYLWFSAANTLSMTLYGVGGWNTTVVATPQTTGEHDYKVICSAKTVTVYDGNTAITAPEVFNYSMVNGVDAWLFAAGNRTSYIEYIKMTIAGTLRGSWAWQNATTFTDLSGNSNTATPTFRTTASIADITASLVSFVPAYPSPGGIPVTVTAAPFPITFPAETQTTTAVDQSAITNLPGGNMVLTYLTDNNIPPGLISYPFMMLCITGACFLAYWKPKDVWWAELAILAVSGIFIAAKMLPWAFLVLDAIPFAFVIVKRGGFSRA